MHQRGYLPAKGPMRENTVNISFTKLSAVLVVATAITPLCTPDEAFAQRRFGKAPPRYRPTQYEARIPTVDLPTPAMEGESYPAMDDAIPPSVQGAQPYYPQDAGPDPTIQAPADRSYSVPNADQEYQGLDSYDDPVVDAYDRYDGSIDDAYGSPGGVTYSEMFLNEEAPLYSTGTWFRRGSWYTQLEVLAWTRSDTRDGDLGSGRLNLILNGNGTNYLFNQLVSQNFAPGARLKLGQFLGRDAAGRDHMWEVGWLGGFSWDDTRLIESRQGGSVNTLLSSQSDVFLAPFFGADSQTVYYDADLNSGELNYKVRTRPGRDMLAMQPNGEWVRHGVGSQVRSFMAGLRYMSFNELVDYSSRSGGFLTETDRVTGDTGTEISNESQANETDDFLTGRYRVRTHNDMVGFQIGGEFEEKFDALSIQVGGKLGGLFDFADRRSTLSSINRVRTLENTTFEPTLDGDGNFVFRDPDTGDIAVDDPDTPDVDESQIGTQVFDQVLEFENVASTNFSGEKVSDESLVFLAELGLTGTYQLRPNLYFRAGYDLMFLSAVALAPENMDLDSGFGAINVNGSVLLHGGSIGFEGTW